MMSYNVNHKSEHYNKIMHACKRRLLISWIDGDLLTREYSLLYEPEANEASLMLEVVDDNIAENEEIFIIYTGVIEDPGDICARVVRLQDNDGKKNILCTQWIYYYNNIIIL